MRLATPLELPEELQTSLKKARKLEWVTICYLLSVVVVMYLVMGASQAMKTAWLEVALSILPAIAFLIASTIFDRQPTPKFPYGYHRAFGIAFLAGSLALFAMGGFLVVDSSMALIRAEHPTIGSTEIFGRQIWMGWIMILALLYSAGPAMILGFRKHPLAKQLHNKILKTDADAQKADYMTAVAAMAGIIGVGFGLWWADAVAALFISVSVLKDGFTNLKTAIQDLMDSRPSHTENSEKDELVDEVEHYIRSWQWVDRVRVRFREAGQVYFGEVMVTVRSEENLVENIAKGIEDLEKFHWKIYDVVVVPVRQLPEWGGED